ncbi:hypothetical protein HN51_052561 [Arachis hypogaea]|nr:probable calcium-binding protein CML44 [Arachis ipaensis]XP_025668557.1 probable calcium-binding protein CML44 [Arachis hypogaea]QHN93913.1 putative calcium-binding protein [Arachis hypogaea]
MLFANMTSSVLTATDLRRIFEKLDMNCDGFVSLEELNWLLHNIGFQLTLDELESLVEKKSLNLNEFLFFYDSIISKKNCNDDDDDNNEEMDDELLENDLVETFKVFDLDGDGFITSNELQCVLKRLGLWDERGGKDCGSMIRFYDTNSDGQLDFEEFKNMMFLTITTA